MLIIGKTFRFFETAEGMGSIENAADPYNYIVRSYEPNNLHYYLKEDGSEPERETYSDLDFLASLPNLQILKIVCADLEQMPDLTGTKLRSVSLQNCTVPDLKWLSGTNLHDLILEDVQNGLDFSPLTDCGNLDWIQVDFGDTTRVSLDGFAPPKLRDLNLGSGAFLDPVDLNSLAACTALENVNLFNMPINNLNFLKGKEKIRQLQVHNSDTLGDISAVATLTNLEECEMRWNRQINDFSALAECKKLKRFHFDQTWDNNIRDVSFLEDKPYLESVQLYGCQLQNLDFLKQVSVYRSFDLAVHGNVRDWSALASVSFYTGLNIRTNDRKFETIRPYLDQTRIDYLQLNDFKDLDLSRIPVGIKSLELCGCDLKDLSGLPEMKLREFRLNDLQELSSLSGMEVLKNSKLDCVEIYGSPRLTDWSAAAGLTTTTLNLIGTYTMPDLGTISFTNLRLDSLSWLEDLSCLEGLKEEKFYNLDLLGLDLVTDLSPVRRLRGHTLRVSPVLKEQAESLVEEGRFGYAIIEYPNAGWGVWQGNVELKSLDELDTLPLAALKRVENLTLAGDRVINWDTHDLWERWDENGRYFTVFDRETEEETRVEAGTMADLSRLQALTGLREVEIVDQPLTNLDGIGDMLNLERLVLKECRQMEDISQAFTLEKIRQIEVFDAPISSIQGVQNLTSLEQLCLHQTNVTDISPLAECDLTEAYQGDGLTLELYGNEPLQDGTPLESIRKYNRVSLNGGNFDEWIDHIQNAEITFLGVSDLNEEKDLTRLPKAGIHSLRIDSIQELTSLHGLEELIASGDLEELEILGCPRLTDWTALEGGYIPKLWLYGTYMIPDLQNMNLGTLRLEQISWLTDLSALETIGQEREINLELADLENLTDLSALKKIKGNRLAVTEDLLNKARAIVNGGSFKASEIADGDGWGLSNDRLRLTSLEELNTLPDNVLAMVTEVYLAGDEIIDTDRYRTEYNWDYQNPMRMDLVDCYTGEHSLMEFSGMTDLSCLSKLTGLRRLDVDMSGITTLAGIENMTRLEELSIRCAPNLTDVSAAWGLKNLEYLEFNQTGAESIEGIQNLTNLLRFRMYGVLIRDISPLKECNFTRAYENGGADINLDIDQDADMTPIEGIRQFRSLDLNDWQVEQWLPHIRNATVGNLTLQNWDGELSMAELPEVTGWLDLHNLPQLKDLTGLKSAGLNGIQLDNLQGLTSLNGIQDLLKEGLEYLDIGGCPRLTDWSALDEAKPGKLRIYGGMVFLPEELKKIAEPVNQEIDPGEWWNEDVSFSVGSLEELQSLPDALKDSITELWIAGDRIYDRNRYDVWDRWENDEMFFELHDMHTDERTPVETGTMTDLTALSGLKELKGLHIDDQPLTSLAGIESLTALEQLEIRKAPALESMEPALGLENLGRIMIQGTGIYNLDGIQKLKKLTSVRAFDNQQDIGWMNECDFSYAYENGGLELYLNIDWNADMTPLEGIREFAWLQLDWGKAERFLPHLQNAVVHELQVNDEENLDLSQLPTVTDRLSLHSMGCITDLTGLKEPGPYTLQLDALPNLKSLTGIEGYLHGGGIREIEIGGCPRIADWSALEGADFDKLIIYGDLVFVPESLQSMVERTDNGWWENNVSFWLTSPEELDTLPESAIRQIREVFIAGDEFYDPQQFHLEDRGAGRLLVVDNNSGQEKTVKTGKGMDLGFLNRMTGLESLTLACQPITDLEAVRPLTGLKHLNVGFCKKLKDITALADLPELESFRADFSGLVSLEGLEGHKKLRSLDISGLNVKDLSPLAACDYTMAAEQGGVELNIDMKQADYTFLSAIPRFGWIGMGGINPDQWIDHVSGAQIRGCYCGAFTQEQLERFLNQHPELGELHIPGNTKVTDLSMLPGMENLYYVKVTKNMGKALKSLEGLDYRFELQIDN